MRVIQTKNDTIRLIFNPKTDGLCLSDFLIVRDGKDNFLAQIVEIYDDKFNQEENVAGIKLVYRILPDFQVVPYDNFTPSRECEIAKIKPEEIEKCLNIDKITVPFGISAKNNKIVEVNLDFFNNNPVVFADKLDEVNCAFENIAQKLKSHRTVVVIDYTGNLNIKNAKRIKAREDFKLPLDSFSLDYIQEKALREVSPEATSELEDMFVELKKFSDSTEDKYIPFPRFIKVIEQQYKATPVPELHLLLTRLKRYSNDGLFSRSKKEFQAISKAVQKENIVIIDFSNLKLEWHREFLEFTVRQIKDFDAYLLLRLNENNSNPEFINNLYLQNPKLNIISSISYGFAKMPQVMEFTRNYILYKTLNPRRDFGFANYQIAALNSSSFLIFGKDTMDFMFTLKNYIFDEEDINKVEDKKIYIDLNLELEEMTSVELAEGNFDLKNVHIQNDRKRLGDAVAINEILPGYGESKEETQDTREEAESAEELQDVPLVEDEIKDENPVENEPEISEEETEIEEVSTETETIEQIAEVTQDETAEIIKEHSEVKKEELSVVADDAKVAELIEASLKNDEEYIKEISVKNNEENEIPLNEDELDYFVNPETADTPAQNSDNTEEVQNDEVITSEMISDAVNNENLEKELEKGLEIEADNALKKKSKDTDEAVKQEDKAEETAIKQDVKEQQPVNPVASEPEMIKEVPVKEEPEKETLESLKEEAHSVLEQESVQKALAVADKEETAIMPAGDTDDKTSVVPADTETKLPVSADNTANIPAENLPETQEESIPAKSQTAAPKKVNPDEAIIIVKEKPNLLIDDFSENTDETSEESALQDEEDTVSLKELAQKSIEARFDEVIQETRKPAAQKKNKLQINENVSIDIDVLKNKEESTQSSLPIFKNNEADEDIPGYDFAEGMKVSHEKYGTGNILKVVKYSNRCLLQIEFEESGKRLLDPKIAKIKPIQ